MINCFLTILVMKQGCIFIMIFRTLIDWTIILQSGYCSFFTDPIRISWLISKTMFFSHHLYNNRALKCHNVFYTKIIGFYRYFISQASYTLYTVLNYTFWYFKCEVTHSTPCKTF